MSDPLDVIRAVLAPDAVDLLRSADRIAAASGSTGVTVAHLAGAFALAPRGASANALESLGVNLPSLAKALGLAQIDLTTNAGAADIAPDLRSLIEDALTDVIGSGADAITGCHLLLRIFDGQHEEEPFVRLLADAGISRAMLDTAVDRAQNVTTEPTLVPARKAPHQALLSIDRHGTDLTDLARAGKIDPLIGRDDEIERIATILTRRTKNNPLLIGAAGVGKTAIAEGLALRVAEGNVPPALLDCRIVALPAAALIAGTSMRGTLEARLTALVAELERHPEIIVFIDEIHSIVGAGDSLDVANILKPALARGAIHCIGATTPEDYHRYIERDAALERRFQPVMVEPTSVTDTRSILAGLAPRYAAHHRVVYAEAALDATVQMAARFLPDRNFPDKAVDVLDEAGSLASLRSNGVSSAVVTPADVATVVSRWSGVPLEQVEESAVDHLAGLESRLLATVIGQDEAVATVATALHASDLALHARSGPRAVFLFAGPPGVGKRTMAGALAREIGGTDDALVRLDLAEFAEPHTIARLIGAPPGYVGSDEPSMLVEPIRRRPHSVVLFERVEHAHRVILDVLTQTLDQGRLTDMSGRVTSLRETVVIFTTTIGFDDDTHRRVGFTSDASRHAAAMEAIRGALGSAFVDRMDEVVEFEPLSPAALQVMFARRLDDLVTVGRARGVTLVVDDALRAAVLAPALRGEGGRNIEMRFRRLIERPFARAIVRACPAGSTLRLGIVNDEPTTVIDGV